MMDDLGFSQALIAQKELKKSTIDSVFSLLLLIGFITCILLYIISPYISVFYKIPQLASILRIIGISVIISLSFSVSRSIMQKELLFDKYNKIIMVSSIVSSITAILLAVFVRNYWALIIPELFGSITSVILSTLVIKYIPKLYIKWNDIKNTFKFGTIVWGTNVLNLITNNSSQLFMGKTWDSNYLGIYNFADKRSMQLFDLIAGYVTAPIFPLFRKISNEKDIKNTFLKVTNISQMLALLMCAYLILFTDKIIITIFGKQWYNAIPVFRILASFIFVRSFGMIVSSTFYGINKPERGLYLAISRFITTVPAIFIMMSYSASYIKVAYVFVIINSIIGMVYYLRCYSDLKINFKEIYGHTKNNVFAFFVSIFTVIIMQRFNVFFVINLFIPMIIFYVFKKDDIHSTILTLKKG